MTISRLFNFVAGQPIKESEVDAEFDQLVTTINTQPYRVGHTYSVPGEIKVPVGDADHLPPFYVPVAAGKPVDLIAVRHKIRAGTSVTFKITKNGVDVTGFTGLVADTTGVHSDPADVALADGDLLQVVVTAVSGTPRDFTATLVLEHGA